MRLFFSLPAFHGLVWEKEDHSSNKIYLPEVTKFWQSKPDCIERKKFEETQNLLYMMNNIFLYCATVNSQLANTNKIDTADLCALSSLYGIGLFIHR